MQKHYYWVVTKAFIHSLCKITGEKTLKSSITKDNLLYPTVSLIKLSPQCKQDIFHYYLTDVFYHGEGFVMIITLITEPCALPHPTNYPPLKTIHSLAFIRTVSAGAKPQTEC